MAVSYFLSEIYKAGGRKKSTIGILLDFSTAFDAVSLPTFLYTSHVGVKENRSYAGFSSYVTDSKQFFFNYYFGISWMF